MLSRKPTQADVAKRAGVSKTTVGFVLADRYDISIPEATRQRVKQAASEIHYKPNLTARALVTGRTNVITIAFPGTIEAYHSKVLQVFERITNAHGYHLIATTIGHIEPSNALPDLWELINGPNDAVILVDVFDRYRPYVAELVPSSTKPIIAMGITELPSVDCVHIDLSEAATAACEHLFQPNSRHVVYLGANVHQTEIPQFIDRCLHGDADPRGIAFCRAATRHGLAPIIIGGTDWDRSSTISVLERYVMENGCPDAIMCVNDVVAIRAIGFLRKKGYRIPEDIRIIGCDGIESGEDMHPSLSTIAQPVNEMCNAAWEMLEVRWKSARKEIQHNAAVDSASVRRQCIHLSAELVIRGSSDSAA